MSSRSRVPPAMLAAHLEGEVTLSERAAIEAELRDSAQARRTLEQLRNLSELLAAPATDLENIDLASRVREKTRQVSRERPPRSRRGAALLLGGLAACLGGALFFVHRPQEISEFREKGSDAPALSGRRWAGMQIQRVAPHGNPGPLGTTIAPEDGLLFSYTNLGPHPFDYLMIFATDASAEVRWYYPAYESAADNPQSIAITRGGANVPLGELVQQDFADGPLSLYALFTARPLSVREVEAWLKQHGPSVAESPVADGVLQRIETRVER
ncbi:MAG TPA: hypothetical protein VER04_16475 [Polyangiaceae bacterium]|nr:hypothetical protein [Polyangiaceae bacterium]